ncbi:hypothetical protein ACSBR1_040408 [Camellia fascicularis]
MCQATVDIGWSTLDDLCIHDGKLLGCSYYQTLLQFGLKANTCTVAKHDGPLVQ